MSLVNNEYIKKISDFNLKYGSGITFHKKASKYLSKFSDKDFIVKVFKEKFNEIRNSESNNLFPNFEFFNNTHFSLRFNFFLRNESLESNEGIYLIHHHGNNILTTQMIYGPGYRAINFESKKYPLVVKKKIHHQLKNTYSIDEYTPHIIFNVESFSVTCNLWTTSSQNIESSQIDRENFYFKNGIYFKIKDSEIREFSIVENSNKSLLFNCYIYWLNSLGIELDYLNNHFSIDKSLTQTEPKINNLRSILNIKMKYEDF